jgi:hypothetical protein
LIQNPTICLDLSAVPAFGLFNPNDWHGPSRGVVLSCSTEYSVLHYGIGRIKKLCQTPMDYCRVHFETFQEQWKRAGWDLSKGAYFAQVPELHALIEAFFAGTKALLDLVVQLLTTEAVVAVNLDGFHRAGFVYGGGVLNALSRNARASRGNTAKAIARLILRHKATWIDDVINARDFLVYPKNGSHQLMFQLRLATRDGDLVVEETVPPHVGSIRIDDYVTKQMGNIEAFAQDFMKQLLNK